MLYGQKNTAVTNPALILAYIVYTESPKLREVATALGVNSPKQGITTVLTVMSKTSRHLQMF